MKKRPVRFLLETIYRPFYKLYSLQTRSWEYKDLKISVFPGVFHPGLFFTSKILLAKVEAMDLEGMRVLDLGCGTGVLACLAASKQAEVFASDITRSACDNAIFNAAENSLSVQVIHSDIFEGFGEDLVFDIIFSNPPFIPEYPELESDFAFFCGESHEYYEFLFSKLSRHLDRKGTLIMALAESCDLDCIIEISRSHNFSSERLSTATKWSEQNYLYAFRQI